MTFNKKGLMPLTVLAFVGIYLVSFIIYYLGTFIIDEENIFIYIDLFLDKAIFILLPAVAALTALIPAVVEGRFSPSLIRMTAPSAARIVYFLPYFYLMCISGGLDSVDSLLFGLLFSVADAALAYAFSVIIFFAMRIIMDKKRNKDEELSDVLTRKTVLNFSEPVSFSFICIAFASFVYFLVSEIINTITFLIEYPNFRISEIIYTVFSYVYALILLLLYYHVLSAVKNMIVRKRLSE